jgi:tRNA pseudouridine38-40 synthase
MVEISVNQPVARESDSANWKLVLAYDGTDFHGWQIQPGNATIQGELAAAIYRVTGETVLPQGSGRTDAGVHARAQVASCVLRAPIPAANFLRALNRTLPSAIRVLSTEVVEPDFHARHSAVAKTYEYRVMVADPFVGTICSPWQARFVYAVERPLNRAAMQEAAALVLGANDFTSFAAFDPDRSQRQLVESESVSNIRTISHSSWTLVADESAFVYRVTGNGFLHHMVRNLVGTFLETGWGERRPDDIPRILAAKQRAAAGRTAPARGLFLDHVDYKLPSGAKAQVLR